MKIQMITKNKIKIFNFNKNKFNKKIFSLKDKIQFIAT